MHLWVNATNQSIPLGAREPQAGRGSAIFVVLDIDSNRRKSNETTDIEY